MSNFNNLISYTVIEGNYSARLYIQPRKKMLLHHTAIINTIISSINIALDKNLSIQQLENAATIDPLTNCYNRRALDTYLENDIAYAKRHGFDLSIVMLDLDDFKLINDVYGHQAGDAVLKAISSLIPSAVRKSDYLARYGGEEFVLVLPDSTLYSAVQVAHKLREIIQNRKIHFGGKTISISASFGVASLESKQDGSSLLREADERLYKAKALGKNNVVPSLLPCFADKHFVSLMTHDHYAGAGRRD
jgi:diguanylate cyclase (GGDEF)-like protein